MKLTDLDASFVAAGTAGGHRRVAVADAQGVMFQCPHCAQGLELVEEDGRRFFRGVHYVLVWFAGRHVPTTATPLPRWAFSGTGLEDLTLQPSVSLASGCAWHGYVRDGDAA